MKEGRNRLISHKTYRLLSYLQSHSVWRAVSTVREQRTGGSVSTSQLETLLYTHTASEQWHLENPDAVSPRYESVPKILVEDEKVMLFNWENTLQERAVGMIKETRFTSIPPHINHDMELNFIYEGSCDFVVNGRRFREMSSYAMRMSYAARQASKASMTSSSRSSLEKNFSIACS